MADVSAGKSPGEVDALLGLEGPAPARWLARWKTALLAAGVLAAVLGALQLARSLGSEAALQYATEPVTHGDLHVLVTATGSVQPTDQIDVSSELSGIVRSVRVDFNDRVRAGEVLAQLDTDRLAASVASARARLEAARARVVEAEITLREAEREYTRQHSLAAGQFSAARELDAARAARDRAIASRASARAEVGVAQADLRLSATNLAKASITSPIDGIVLARNVNPGQTVAASLQAPVLFSIAEDLTRMEVGVAVDEADVGQVREGQSASLSVDAYPDRSFAARIRALHLASETVQGVVTYEAVLSVDNPERLLRPGMTATALIAVEELRDALLVPNAALRFSPPVASPPAPGVGSLRGGLPRMPAFRPASPHEPTGRTREVWVLRAGRAAAVEVVVGASDGASTQILAGDLHEGEAVIVDATRADRS